VKWRKNWKYLAAAHDTLVLVVTKGAFVTDTDESGWANVAVTDWALAVAFVAEASDRDASLFAAHNEIAEDISMQFLITGTRKLTDDGETCFQNRVRCLIVEDIESDSV